MTNTGIAILVILVCLVTASVVWLFYANNRSTRLRRQFGPEYERLVREHGSRRRAEAVLAQRTRRVERLEIRPLEPTDRARFADEWRIQQTRFVDDPRGAVTEADRLVTEVMRERGYPMGDFEQRAADISVDHPQVVQNYRAAHTIALRHERGEAGTEDLRNAMVHYRALFDELLGHTEEVRRYGGTA